ncbi:MFS transporter [Bacillus sp. JJ722]|uniref:MFS transporter n=1 Tax=Bacillus sp. JJ722 TaxID=3122973 RepID=UPI002FFEB538
MVSNRNVWILMMGEFIANVGLWLGVIGNLEFLQNLVPSDFLKSLILLLGMFAGVLFGPLAGKVIDQSSKKKVMIYSSILRIISVFFMFFAIWNDSIMWMCVYMVLIGIANAFYLPALQATIPLIVQEHQLMSINSLHMNIGTIARIMGTAIAGILLLSMTLFQIYFLSMVSYIFILICTFMLQIKNDAAKPLAINKQKTSGGFKELWPMIASNKVILMSLILLLVPTLFIGSFNLMVLEISELQGDPSIKSWLYTSEGLCFMLGAFFARRTTGNRNPLNVMLFAALLMATSHLSLYFADLKVPAIITFGIFGLAAGIFFPISATIFQTMVNRELHGRFFSFKGMVDRVLFQIILVCAGLFLDTIGFKNMILVFGSISMIIVILFAINRNKVSNVQIYKNKAM